MCSLQTNISRYKLAGSLREAITQSNTRLLILNVPSLNGISHRAAESCWHISFTYTRESPSDSSSLWDIWINEVALYFPFCLHEWRGYRGIQSDACKMFALKHFKTLQLERLRNVRAVLLAWRKKGLRQWPLTVKNAERIRKQTLVTYLAFKVCSGVEIPSSKHMPQKGVWMPLYTPFLVSSIAFSLLLLPFLLPIHSNYLYLPSCPQLSLFPSPWQLLFGKPSQIVQCWLSWIQSRNVEPATTCVVYFSFP